MFLGGWTVGFAGDLARLKPPVGYQVGHRHLPPQPSLTAKNEDKSRGQTRSGQALTPPRQAARVRPYGPDYQFCILTS